MIIYNNLGEDADIMSLQSLYTYVALIFTVCIVKVTQPLINDIWWQSVFLLHFIDLSASAGSKVVVITANAWSDEQSYLSVVQTNVDMYRGIIPRLAQLSPKAVLLIASQPGSENKSKLALFIIFINASSLTVNFSHFNQQLLI